ncbi:hypothetical protein EDC04DRAFT_2705908 [Pisolithus marmoratus]|nr:hypothetical protein EDC04DRAFT_2705908 [Pisolithus marmoratus]
MPPHRSYHQSKEASTKRPCKYCGNLDLPRGIISHEKSCIKALLDKKEQEKHSKIYIRNLRRARIAREAAAGAAVALACAGFSGSAATVMPEPPMKPSAGRSQPNPVTGMINSHGAHSHCLQHDVLPAGSARDMKRESGRRREEDSEGHDDGTRNRIRQDFSSSSCKADGIGR